MSRPNDLKDARIEFKTSKDIKALLQEAANSLGMDLSNFFNLYSGTKSPKRFKRGEEYFYFPIKSGVDSKRF